ncbi:MAG: hypothetical protein ACXAEN_13840 [Candidatus Thorarchaeota archaeon]|jgi:hypothetical protein
MLWTLLHSGVVVLLVFLHARYPDYGRSMWHCLTRVATLRPCDIGFHDKARATLTSMAMRVHIRLARFVYKHFEAVSIVSVIMFIVFLWNLSWGIVQIIGFFIQTGGLL